MARYPRRFGSPAARAQSRAAFTAMGGFLPVLGAALSSVIESNTVTLSGLVGSPALTINGGQYSKNGAAYSSAATTVTNGDTLKLRVTSPGTAGATSSVVATIDGTARTFSVTTAAADTGTPTPTPGPTPTPTPGAIDYPRMGMVGPSTIAHNNYATNTASILRGGNNAAGPITWLNATSPYRVQIINDFDTSNTKLYYGDNAALGGLDFDAWPAQIAYLATRMAGIPAARRWINYELGRNGISRSLAEHKAALDRDIADMRSKGFTRINVNKLWFQGSAKAGWEKGSAFRQKVVDINSYIDQLVAGSSDLSIIDFPAFVYDPASGNGLNAEPRVEVTRADNQHFASRGGRFGSLAYAATFAPLVVPQTYPAPAPENKIPAMTGSGGVLGPATGEVYSGFTLTGAGSGITTVASRVTNGGKPYQRLAFSGMSNIGSSGASIEMRSDQFAATAGERVNWRCKVRIPATQNPYMFYAALEGGSNTTGARSVAFAPARTDLSTDEVVTTTGTTLTSGSVFNGAADTEDREFWLEGTLPVHVDVDGPLTVVVRFLLRASAVDFVVEIGEFQTFNWAG